jgi:hypothetical protein
LTRSQSGFLTLGAGAASGAVLQGVAVVNIGSCISDPFFKTTKIVLPDGFNKKRFCRGQKRSDI